MARALAFYRLLGPGHARPTPTGSRTSTSRLPGGLRLAFDTEETIASFHPAWKPGTGGRVSLAFALPDPAAVDAAYEQLTAAGHHGELAPFDAFWGMRYATVHDPDGTGVDLFAPASRRGSGRLSTAQECPCRTLRRVVAPDSGRRTPPSKCDGPSGCAATGCAAPAERETPANARTSRDRCGWSA